MWALNRKFEAQEIDLNLNGVGVVCHAHSEQVIPAKGKYQYVPAKRFSLARHPNTKTGESAPIIEEGRMHLELTLVFDVNLVGDSEAALFRQGEEARREALAERIAFIIADMRVAGGTIISEAPTGLLLGVAQHPEVRSKDFRQLRRSLLPGFALVSRADLLRTSHSETESPPNSPLETWLSLCRFNYSAKVIDRDEGELSDEKQVEWVWDRPAGAGWLVPISVGYRALSPLYQRGTVKSSRDRETPFRFVEALHSIGEWLAPHRLTDVSQLLWYPSTDPEKGLYRVINHYTSPAIEPSL